ncbi:MAG: DMT family transporter [Candidatus Aenigmarchaeota archaeon]|nr:DMT family transporter [Candidatus Aenigmarchaeota archaeon]
MKLNDKLTPFLGAIAVIFAASLWGVDGIVLTPNLYHLNVPVVVFLLHFVAFLIMSVFLFREIPKLKNIKKKEWVSFFWIALFGGAIGTMAITQALFLVNFEHLSAIVILQKLQPLFAITLAAILLKERPKKNFYLWAALAIAGSYLITFGFAQPVFEGNLLFTAAIYSVLAAFAFGSSTVFGKKVLEKTDFKLSTYVRFGLTSLIMIIIVLLTGSLGGFAQITMDNMLIIFLIAITTGGTAIFIYYWGLKRIMASKATIYELGFPVTAIVLDYAIHGSFMSAGQWLGTILVIFSMIMIVRLRKNGNNIKKK